MKVGICGFSQSGKSTIFQALSPGGGGSRGGVVYGNIKVPDTRVDRLAAIFSPKKTTFAEITFMDVAGQGGKIQGALGPEVVQAMRNADVLVHVVRAFDSPFHGTPADPARAVSDFHDELVLLDLAILEKRGHRFAKENRKDATADVNARCVDCLENGDALRDLDLDADQRATLQGIQLLSLTPLITLYNLGEDDWADSPLRSIDDKASMALCGLLEAEIAQMEPEEQEEFLAEMELGEPARNEFIRAAFTRLDLISFLTAGPDECRAWPVRRGSNARTSAGTIHSDLERGFIRAEVYRLDDLEAHGSEAELKKVGKLRVEGKDYVVQDGDVMHVRFNV